MSGYVDGSVDIQLDGDTAVVHGSDGQEQRVAVGAGATLAHFPNIPAS